MRQDSLGTLLRASDARYDLAAMDDGIRIALIWIDSHMLELRIRVTNGRFAAETSCYESHDVALRLTSALRGFPSSAEDRRELELGDLSAGGGQGGCRIVMRCTDGLGAAVAEVTVLAAEEDCPPETASFSIRFDANAVDEFVSALAGMRLVVGSEATLQGRTS